MVHARRCIRLLRWSRTLFIALAAVLASAAGAHAQGINLAWDDCGAHGHSCKGFSCNGNTGARFPMVASFVPSAGIDYFIGASAELDIHSSTAALPD